MKSFFKKKIRSIGVSLVCGLVLPLVAFTIGWAEDQLIVSSGNVLYLYALDGRLIQQMEIPATPECCGVSRDLVAIGEGALAVYNGTFSPVLNLFDGETRQWAGLTAEGWSTVNNVSYGGIASYGSLIFASDMATGGGGVPNGIIRFDLEGGGWERFFSGQDYIDLTVGLDDRLYGLRNTYGDLDVIDPHTMQFLYSLDLGHTSGVRGVAVQADGTIFAASWNGNIYRYDSTALLLDTFAAGMGSLIDIDLNASGTLVVGARSGDVALSDESFSFFTIIDVNDAYLGAFVSFGQLPATPEIAAEFPWRDNLSGNAVTDIPWNYAMGYHFTPLVDGHIVRLGGYFNGSKQVRLFDRYSGELLAETTVTSLKDWSYADIDPIPVQAGLTYTVAVYLAGSGGVYRWGVDPFPQTYQNIRIDGTAYAYTGFDPDARPIYTSPYYMFGQADIVFIPVE